MNVQPIQVLNSGVLIPIEYLPNAEEYIVVLENGHAFVRPKLIQSKVERPTPEISQEEYAELRRKHPWIGSIEGLPPDLSTRYKDILRDEIDPRSGWTTKSRLPSEKLTEEEYQAMIADPEYQELLAEVRKRFPLAGTWDLHDSKLGESS